MKSDMATLLEPRKNLLLLSGGSKVAISRIAKAACQKRGTALHITDTSANVPSRLTADRFHILPPNSERSWGQELIELCETQKIGLLLPTRHADLAPLSLIQEELEAVGTTCALSSRQALDICLHKANTASFFSQNEIPAPLTLSKGEVATETDVTQWPLIAKPTTGSASHGIRTIHNAQELSSVPDNWILQTLASGNEYTINIYLNQDGSPLCFIPHRRLITSEGEVMQGCTERIPELIELCRKVASSLPGAKGIINVQAFYDPTTRKCQFIEINPRIGGGYPLCDAAKGSYIEWLCQEYIDQTCLKPFDAWTNHLHMMRYRDAVFSVQSE